MALDLSKVPLFRSLTKSEQDEVAAGLGEETYKKGEKIFSQGDTGDAFYIVVDGGDN
jgi:CRP-like cAMP-binding protein